MTTETAARKALALAEVIRDYWEVELPKRFKNYPFENPGEDAGPPPPEEKKLRLFLARLKQDILYKIALIMYLGRGNIDTHDLPGEYQAVRKDFENPSELISFLMEKAMAPLAEHLEEGMAILKTHNIDLDKLDLATAEA